MISRIITWEQVGWLTAHLALWGVLFVVGLFLGVCIAGQSVYEEILVKHITGHEINNRQVFHAYQPTP